MTTVETKKERLLGLENHLLTKLMDVRYALDDPFSGPIKQSDLSAIRNYAGKFTELADEIEKQQDKEYKEEYGDD